jgi:hypothetical protein
MAFETLECYFLSLRFDFPSATGLVVMFGRYWFKKLLGFKEYINIILCSIFLL